MFRFRLLVQNLSLNSSNKQRLIHVTKRSLSSNNKTTYPTQRCIRTACASSEKPPYFRVINHIENREFLDSISTNGSNVETDDLEIELTSGHRLVVNLTWLRDSCHCEQCTHKYSRQRLFTINNFKRDKFVIKDVQFSTESSGESDETCEYLKIRWADGHCSLYPMYWLKEVDKLYRKSQLKWSDQVQKFQLPNDDFYLPVSRNAIKQDYWTVEKLESNLKPVEYNNLVDGFTFQSDNPNYINANNITDMSLKRFESILSLSEQLMTYGIARIVNVPAERDQVLKVARSLAYERPTGYGTVFDVVVEPSEEINLAYSSQEFDLHSDLTYREMSPGVQLLHCISNSDEGGLSYFSDAFQAAELLQKSDPKLYDVLVQFPGVFVVRDPYRDVKFRRQKTILTLDKQGKLSEVYYSPFMLPPIGYRDDVKLFYLALDKFTQLLQSPNNKYITKMELGDLFIFHNRRVLHGRSAYDSTRSERFLQGCYMDWDEIGCLYEKMISNK